MLHCIERSKRVAAPWFGGVWISIDKPALNPGFSLQPNSRMALFPANRKCRRLS